MVVLKEYVEENRDYYSSTIYVCTTCKTKYIYCIGNAHNTNPVRRIEEAEALYKFGIKHEKCKFMFPFTKYIKIE